VDSKHTVNVDALKTRNESIRHLEFYVYPSTPDNTSDDDESKVHTETNILIDMNRENALENAQDTITQLLSEHFSNPSKNTKEAIEFEVDQLVLSFPPTSSFTVDIKDSIGRVQTLKEALDASRHYNFDLSPKLLSCRGEMVEVLIKSGIGRYLEFKGLEESYVFEAESKTFDKVSGVQADFM
jgi:RAB protein geranylgeranyltransferase component A